MSANIVTEKTGVPAWQEDAAYRAAVFAIPAHSREGLPAEDGDRPYGYRKQRRMRHKEKRGAESWRKNSLKQNRKNFSI